MYKSGMQYDNEMLLRFFDYAQNDGVGEVSDRDGGGSEPPPYSVWVQFAYRDGII